MGHGSLCGQSESECGCNVDIMGQLDVRVVSQVDVGELF